MKNYLISKSRRLRGTPYTSRIEKQGVTAYTVYNHMLLPTKFEGYIRRCIPSFKEVMYKFGMYQYKDKQKLTEKTQLN